MSDELKKQRLAPLKEKNVLSDKGTVTSFVYARPDFMEKDVYPYIKDVEAFYFAGGEPLLHPEHYDILMYLLDNNMTNKRITYSTNMTTFSWKKTNFLEVWKNFSRITFFCSIDGDNERLEYIRERTKNDVVMNNLKKLIALKNEGREGQFDIRICYTHSIFNAYYTREFFDYLDEIGVLNELSDVELNFAYGDDLSLSILPKWAKEELKEKRLKDLESESLQRAFELWPRMKKAWFNVDKLIDEESDKPLDILLNRDLFDYEKAKEALPWLASVVKRYKIL
jgi:organic radical activating enzyme